MAANINKQVDQPAKLPLVVQTCLGLALVLFAIGLYEFPSKDPVVNFLLTLFFILGAAVCFYAPLNYFDTKFGKYAGLPKVAILAEGVIVASLVGLHLEVPHIKDYLQRIITETPKCYKFPDINLDGRWEYRVLNDSDTINPEEDKIGQIGWANFEQQKLCTIKIVGRRTHDLRKTAKGTLCKEPHEINWVSTAGHLYGEGTVELLFKYKMMDGSDNGIVDLYYGDRVTLPGRSYLIGRSAKRAQIEFFRKNPQGVGSDGEEDCP